MSAGSQALIHRAKAILCIAITLYTPVFLTGCGPGGLSQLFAPAGQYRIPLNSSHPLSQALVGSPFAYPSAIDVFPETQAFELVYRTGSQKLAGKYQYQNDEFTITEFSVAMRSLSATIYMDDQKRVSRIRTGDGMDWKREETSRLNSANSNDDGVDAYLAANTDLLDVARQLDEELNTAGPIQTQSPSTPVTPAPDDASTATPPKTSMALSTPLKGVLLILSSIWYPIVGIVQPLIAIFTVASILQATLVLRLDGTWEATNAGSALEVTVSGGKINRLIIPQSGQQLQIIDSRLDSVSGNRVVWSVEAQVLGQNTSVNFEFDVRELANGQLEGTLTTIGDSLARVPVTLTRIQ